MRPKSYMREIIPDRRRRRCDFPNHRKKFSGHGHPRFYILLEELAKLHSTKNRAYAGDDLLKELERVSKEEDKK